MKIKNKLIKICFGVLGTILMFNACTENLLNQTPPDQISSDIFWKNPDDALSATYGTYEAFRHYFRFDFYFDGFTPYALNKNESSDEPNRIVGDGDDVGKFDGVTGKGDDFEVTWGLCYQIINRANYVILNIDNMIAIEEEAIRLQDLKRLRGENAFMRAMAYQRLISLWGDVPYFDKPIESNDQAYTLARTPIKDINDKIIEDYTYAIDNLPMVNLDEHGRISQAAAYAFRGKAKLFWASWKRFGWPELEGFIQDESEAVAYFNSAAEDFKYVIEKYGLTLFRGGDPGTIQRDSEAFDPMLLPNYWHLFQYFNETDPEIILSCKFAGPDLGQGSDLTYNFGSRSTFFGRTYMQPTNHLIDMYQLIATGKNAPKLVLSPDPTIPNGSINLNSYKDRDYRMKASIVWEGEPVYSYPSNDAAAPFGGILTLKWGNPAPPYINYDDLGTGILFRKWVRQEPLATRNDGEQDYYLLRLPDVYLMYCEAVNEASGPNAELVGLINQIRRRGNLPDLTADTYTDKEVFFETIWQERVVELIGEGQIGLDIRRRRLVEKLFVPPLSPEGFEYKDTFGQRTRLIMENEPQLEYERFYIFQIPESERERNPNMTQNIPWR